MPHRRAALVYRTNWAHALFLLPLFLDGCVSHPPVPPPPPAMPTFPPQHLIETGDYAAFLAENERTLQSCNGESGCATALFNLGFVHAYAPNPYRDFPKALQYFSELRSKYPHSQLAVQGQAWGALITEQMMLEEDQRKLQADLRSKEATIRNLQEQLNRSREIDIEMQKKERELLR